MLRDGDGGVYWLLATVLPGFRQFRFPAKLFTFTALGLAALAAMGWDRLRCQGRARGTILLMVFLLSSLAMLAGVWIARPLILRVFHTPIASSTFGPFDVEGGFRAIVCSLVHASLVFGLGLLALRLAARRPLLAGVIVLAVTTADLALANAQFVVTVPQTLMESKPEVLQVIEDAERRSPASGPFRVHRMAYWEPRVWQSEASADRTRDLLSWHRDTLYPKVGVNLGVEYTHAFGVGGLADYEPFFRDFPVVVKTSEAAKLLGLGMGERLVYYPRRSFDIWNTRYFIVPCDPRRWIEEYRGYASFLVRSERIYPGSGTPGVARMEDVSRSWIRDHDVQVLRNLDALPRAWVVHDAALG